MSPSCSASVHLEVLSQPEGNKWVNMEMDFHTLNVHTLNVS